MQFPKRFLVIKNSGLWTKSRNPVILTPQSAVTGLSNLREAPVVQPLMNLPACHGTRRFNIAFT
jgi:hypothetical protein